MKRDVMNIENFIDDSVLDSVVIPDHSVKQGEVLSFHQPAFNKQVDPKLASTKKRFIIRSQIIDKFTTKRIRVELTPSVCDVCAFDVAAEKHGSWHNVPEFKKADVIQAVIEHKREAHPTKEDLIIEEDEMSTSWLGSGTTL